MIHLVRVLFIFIAVVMETLVILCLSLIAILCYLVITLWTFKFNEKFNFILFREILKGCEESLGLTEWIFHFWSKRYIWLK